MTAAFLLTHLAIHVAVNTLSVLAWAPTPTKTSKPKRHGKLNGDPKEPIRATRDRHRYIATAILTAGKLLVTVELYAKYREARNYEKIRQEQDRYLNQLHSTQADKLLSAVLPDATIFEQIKSEIIRQPFLRCNLKAFANLPWNDDKSAIRKILNVTYDVENTSTIFAYISIKLWLSADRESDRRSKVDFLERETASGTLSISAVGSSSENAIEKPSPCRFTEKDLEENGYLTRDDGDIRVLLQVRLDSRQIVRVDYKQTTTEKTQDHCSFVSILSAIGLEVIITPDLGIEVGASILHPSGRSIRSDADATFVRVDGALLPYQGVDFYWEPTLTSSTPGERSNG